jgi:hypothetical protein
MGFLSQNKSCLPPKHVNIDNNVRIRSPRIQSDVMYGLSRLSRVLRLIEIIEIERGGTKHGVVEG